ncbi:AzlC family ABC transporter permease [Cohaesibacter gelatinilyticus]|uniref:Predicted branched-chain amino acid permease (Azaleucine resistance) n=1 Tax=Cohaesibacter gelatinilyticus TaxID=372072 RepID=A0A285NKS3_9HYPH|nr:AzlC family ABC transporter permease [Cohaesibacter gelatinilyticus]SNZ08251.1 Predicted branched-chain amino acid permease (azaleucine resistance) [Cohaesibacter gelatinilyticus]
MTISQSEVADERLSAFIWYRRGMRHLLTTPAIVLYLSFIGFGGFARESGVEIGHALAMTGLIWALPSQVVLIGGVVSGAGLAAIALAVTLASIRLMPMVVALVPELRDKDTPNWQLYVLSHVTAITGWVFAMQNVPKLPRYARVPFFAGFGLTLCFINIGVTAIGYSIAGIVPPLAAAALFFMTPLYFLLTLPSAARLLSDRLALVFGIILGPIFAIYVPGSDLVWTGLVGGLSAYAIGRYKRRVT